MIRYGTKFVLGDAIQVNGFAGEARLNFLAEIIPHSSSISPHHLSPNDNHRRLQTSPQPGSIVTFLTLPSPPQPCLLVLFLPSPHPRPPPFPKASSCFPPSPLFPSPLPPFLHHLLYQKGEERQMRTAHGIRYDLLESWLAEMPFTRLTLGHCMFVLRGGDGQFMRVLSVGREGEKEGERCFGGMGGRALWMRRSGRHPYVFA